MLRILHLCRCSARCHEANRTAGGPEIRLNFPGPERRNPLRLVERREAQRLGGKASHAFRSPHARASGRASQTHPNGPRKPVQASLRRQSGNKAPAATEGPRKPLAPPGAPFPFGETEKGTGGAHAEVKQPGGAALAKIGA